MRPERSLVICTLPRSGSTMLCDGLTRTDALGYPAEYYSPAHRTYYEQLIGDKAGNYDIVFDYTLRIGMTPNGVFAAKVLFHQLVSLRRSFDRSGSYPGVPPLQLLDTLLPDPHYLHLVRRDKLAQAISYHRAIASGVWWRLDQQKISAPATRPIYDHAAIAHWLRTMSLWEDAWVELLGRVRGPLLTLYYDEIVDDFTAAILQVHDFLGVAHGREVTAIRPGLQRQSDATTQDWSRRFLATEAATSADHAQRVPA